MRTDTQKGNIMNDISGKISGEHKTELERVDMLQGFVKLSV